MFAAWLVNSYDDNNKFKKLKMLDKQKGNKSKREIRTKIS